MTEKTRLMIVGADYEKPGAEIPTPVAHLKQPVPEAAEAPPPITARVPSEIKAAVDALVRIHLGTGTLRDLAEIALTVHEGRTRFPRWWFLDAVTESFKDLHERLQDAARFNRWQEAETMKTEQERLFNRMQAVLMGKSADTPAPPGSEAS